MTRQRIVKQYFPIGGDFKEERQAAVKYKKNKEARSQEIHVVRLTLKSITKFSNSKFSLTQWSYIDLR